MGLDPKFVWIKTKAVNKSKPFYYYNLANRKTVWTQPDESDGKTMVIDNAEYKDLILKGELPRPVNFSTDSSFGQSSGQAQNQVQAGNADTEADGQSHDNQTGGSRGRKTVHKNTPLTDEHTVINEWEQTRAPDGRLYFYNKRTKETSWHKPDALKIWEDKQKAKGFHVQDVIKNYKEKKIVEEKGSNASPIAKGSRLENLFFCLVSLTCFCGPSRILIFFHFSS